MSKYKHWSLHLDEDYIMWLLFDRADSSVNTLNSEALEELDHILDDVPQDKRTRALVIRSAKKTGFIMGADITQFKDLASSEEATQLIRQGQAVFNKLEKFSV